MPKQDQEITLKSIYEIFLELKKDINKLKDKVDSIDNRLEMIESLPTISKEIKEKELYNPTFKK